MPSNRFFFDGALLNGAEIALDGPEDHHLRHVMRVRLGEQVELVNGRGSLAGASVHALEKRASLLRIQDVVTQAPPVQTIALGIPLLRPSKLEWVVEKGTELGVSAFLLYVADHGELDTLSQHALERLRHVMIAALKQSGRLHLPELSMEKELGSLLNRGGLILFGDTRSSAPWIKATAEPQVVFITGPERGVSEREHALLTARGQGVRLSAHVLRAETAPIAAASILAIP